MVRRLNNYLIMVSLATATLVFGSCTKSDGANETSDEGVMLFGVESIQTKVDYNGVEADFEKGDELGLYAFYNNYYYYYNEYSSFAESVLFANHGLTIDDSKNATYSPLRTWTFSTLYGTAPHTLDVVAYYPFETGYNEDYVIMVFDESGAATLEYYYVNDDDAINNVDYMTACTRYNYSSEADKFREAMLALEYIPLSFTRQMASMNFKITKPEDYETEIIVTGVEVTFDAYKKMTQTIGASSIVTWSNMTENYSLTTSTTCNATLAETVYDYTPSEDATPTVVADLLLDEDLLFFPPGTEIWKIVFTLTDNGEEKEYTWHAHVDEIYANTHYTLNLELDPSRAN